MIRSFELPTRSSDVIERVETTIGRLFIICCILHIILEVLKMSESGYEYLKFFTVSNSIVHTIDTLAIMSFFCIEIAQ